MPDAVPDTLEARALPDMPLLDAARSPAMIFYSYDADNGGLIRALADRVEELEQLVEQREAELHATERDRLRLLEREETPGIPVPIGDLRRLVDLATTGALAESVLGRDAILEDRAGLVLAYRSALGIDEVRS